MNYETNYTAVVESLMNQDPGFTLAVLQYIFFGKDKLNECRQPVKDLRLIDDRVVDYIFDNSIRPQPKLDPFKPPFSSPPPPTPPVPPRATSPIAALSVGQNMDGYSLLFDTNEASWPNEHIYCYYSFENDDRSRSASLEIEWIPETRSRYIQIYDGQKTHYVCDSGGTRSGTGTAGWLTNAYSFPKQGLKLVKIGFFTSWSRQNFFPIAMVSTSTLPPPPAAPSFFTMGMNVDGKTLTFNDKKALWNSPMPGIAYHLAFSNPSQTRKIDLWFYSHPTFRNVFVEDSAAPPTPIYRDGRYTYTFPVDGLMLVEASAGAAEVFTSLLSSFQ